MCGGRDCGVKRGIMVQRRLLRCVNGCGVETTVVMNGAKSRWFGVERGLVALCIHICLIFI